MKEARLAAILIGSLSLAWLAGQARYLDRPNPNSRLATAESLVHRGTFSIVHSPFKTIDKVSVDGVFQSSKLPMLSVILAGTYAVTQPFIGVLHPGDARPVENLITLFSGGWLLLLLFAAYQCTVRLRFGFLATLFVMFGVGFGSPLAGFATTLNNHLPAASATLVAVALLLSGQGKSTRRWLKYLGAGTMLGLAATFDLGIAPFCALVGVWTFFKGGKQLAWFSAGASVPLVAHFALTYALTGSLLPAYLRPELYDYPGTYWAHPPSVIDALNEPRWLYGFHMVFGHHGLLSMTPLFAFALWPGARHLAREHVVLRRIVVGALVATVAVYLFLTHNYGGGCVGFRWLFVYHPLLWLGVGQFIDARPPRGAPLAVWLALFSVGVLHASDAASDPWRRGRWHRAWNRWASPFMERTPPLHRAALHRGTLIIRRGEESEIVCNAPGQGDDRICPGRKSAEEFVGARNYAVGGYARPCIHLHPPLGGGTVFWRLPSELGPQIQTLRVALRDNNADTATSLQVRIIQGEQQIASRSLSQKDPVLSLNPTRHTALEIAISHRTGRHAWACVSLVDEGW